ncbi:MAG TPA: oxidoreductase [Ohtaekwangia sp.]|uniref:oxidoreductase n=1 Tax=Ohtaekwangia sp. TaxID=2066019 RepID=UPI002F957735
MKKVWLITGASQGLGLALVKYLLAHNQQVIATTREPLCFKAKTKLEHPNLEVIGLDLTSEADVKHTITNIIKHYGRIDVLINNAGFGYLGAIEEATQEDIARVFEINVHAALRMIRLVLPGMRSARSGHIVNISSIGGLSASAGFGIYNATKFAVEGFSEALAAEVKDFGIHVTIVEPGYFRTGFLDHSLVMARNDIADYRNTSGKAKLNRIVRNGKQPGNPDLAAKAIFTVASGNNPPLRLLLGEDAYERATQKFTQTLQEFERMKPLTIATAYTD